MKSFRPFLEILTMKRHLSSYECIRKLMCVVILRFHRGKKYIFFKGATEIKADLEATL